MRRRFMDNIRRMGAGKTAAPARERFVAGKVAPLPLPALDGGGQVPAVEEGPEVWVQGFV
jgi:hypothetical protein